MVNLLPPSLLAAVYFFHHARSSIFSCPGHAWLDVPRERSCGIRSLAFHLEKGIPPQPGMTNYDAAPSDRGMSEEESIHLALPGLLRENQNLVLNPAIRTALLFYNEPNGEARVVTEHQFSPSGMCVLIPLLQAYPNYCPYEVLLAHLYPISVEAGRTQLQEARETTIRPVRRAIGTIMDGLHQFGLRACSIRSLGDVLQRLE